MKITLNNRAESFEKDVLTISEILKLKNYTFRMMVIKVNGKLIKKDQYKTTEVIDGDDVQIIHNLALACDNSGRREDAERQYRSSLGHARVSMPRGARPILLLACELAEVLRAGTHLAEAEALLMETWQEAQPPAPAGDPGRRIVAEGLAAHFESLGKEEEAALWLGRAEKGE